MAKGDAQKILQVDEAYADFIGRYPRYNKTTSLDKLRATEYRRLDERHEVYLDYTGASLYAESQLQKHLEILQFNVFGNPHSANPTSAAMTEHVERTRHYVLSYFNTKRTITSWSSRRMPQVRSSWSASRIRLHQVAASCLPSTITTL